MNHFKWKIKTHKHYNLILKPTKHKIGTGFVDYKTGIRTINIAEPNLKHHFNQNNIPPKCVRVFVYV